MKMNQAHGRLGGKGTASKRNKEASGKEGENHSTTRNVLTRNKKPSCAMRKKKEQDR